MSGSAIARDACSRGGLESDPPGFDRWRTDLRNALDQPDKAARRTALLALAKEANLDEIGPISLRLLGAGLNSLKDHLQDDSVVQAESVLRNALFRRAMDFDRKTQGPNGALAIDLTNDLASLLDRTDRAAEAEPYFRALIDRQRA